MVPNNSRGGFLKTYFKLAFWPEASWAYASGAVSTLVVAALSVKLLDDESVRSQAMQILIGLAAFAATAILVGSLRAIHTLNGALTEARARIELLEKQLETRRTNRALVDALMPKLHIAIHDLANGPMVGDKQWKVAMRSWEEATKAKLVEMGGTAQDEARFLDFTKADLARSYPLLSIRAAWVQFRIDALRAIINAYSEGPPRL